MDEQDKFLKDLETTEETDPFAQLIEPEKEEAVEDKPEESDEMQLRNRREKRLAAKLQAERESSIRLAAELHATKEAQKFVKDTDSEYLKGVEKIYGSETPEAVAATELLKKALVGAKEDAKKEALEIIREEQKKASEAVRNEERELDSMIEEIEDETNVIIPEAQKKGFYALLEKMSPKDSDGNVIAYADHHTVWEMYKSKSIKTDTRAKDLSSRSMVSSGASKDSKLGDDSMARFLKEEGII